jgi:cell division protein ZapA
LQKVEVEIFGNRYHVVADDNPDRIVAIAEELDRNMRDIAKRNPGLAATKIAILAALNFADKVERQKREWNIVENRTELLLNLIDSKLND